MTCTYSPFTESRSRIGQRVADCDIKDGECFITGQGSNLYYQKRGRDLWYYRSDVKSFAGQFRLEQSDYWPHTYKSNYWVVKDPTK